jgi:competence protein ComEA
MHRFTDDHPPATIFSGLYTLAGGTARHIMGIGPHAYSAVAMSPNLPSKPTPHWLLRRADQTAVAGLVLAGLASMFVWWVAQGGPSGRLVELDQAEPRSATFYVDVNQASWPELSVLPKVGESLARRIVESREKSGPFVDHDDLLRVKGIGPKTLETIRPYLRPIPSAKSVAGQTPGEPET